MPDLVILDLSMPLKDGLEVVGEVTRLGIPSKILVLTMHNSKSWWRRCASPAQPAM
jgi:DNA-binding NarL/FixJ family response regulator